MNEREFESVITTETELREVYRRPSALVGKKVLARLDQQARGFIDAAPFVLVGTASPDGTADVSPKGGPPGIVGAILSIAFWASWGGFGRRTVVETRRHVREETIVR